MGLINYMVKFFQDGGFWMWPILIVGGIGFAIAIERHIKLAMVKKANKKMWDQLQPVLAGRDRFKTVVSLHRTTSGLVC